MYTNIFTCSSEEFSSNTVYKIQKTWSPSVVNLPWGDNNSDKESESDTSISFSEPKVTKKTKIVKKRVVKNIRKRDRAQIDVEDSESKPVAKVAAELGPGLKPARDNDIIEGKHNGLDRVALQMIPDLYLTSLTEPPDLHLTGLSGPPDLHLTGLTGPSGGVMQTRGPAALRLSSVQEILAASRREAVTNGGINNRGKLVASDMESDGQDETTGNDGTGMPINGETLVTMDREVQAEDNSETQVAGDTESIVIRDDVGSIVDCVDGSETDRDEVCLVEERDLQNDSVVEIKIPSIGTSRKTGKKRGGKAQSARSIKTKGTDRSIRSKLETTRTSRQSKGGAKSRKSEVVIPERSEDSDVVLIEDEDQQTVQKLNDQEMILTDTGSGKGMSSVKSRKSLRLARNDETVSNEGMWDYPEYYSKMLLGSRKRRRSENLSTSEAVGGGEVIEEDAKKVGAVHETHSEELEESTSGAKKRKSLRQTKDKTVGQVSKWDYREAEVEISKLRDRKRRKSETVTSGEEVVETGDEMESIGQKKVVKSSTAVKSIANTTTDKRNASKSTKLSKRKAQEEKVESTTSSKVSRPSINKGSKQQDDEALKKDMDERLSIREDTGVDERVSDLRDDTSRNEKQIASKTGRKRATDVQRKSSKVQQIRGGESATAEEVTLQEKKKSDNSKLVKKKSGKERKKVATKAAKNLFKVSNDTTNSEMDVSKEKSSSETLMMDSVPADSSRFTAVPEEGNEQSKVEVTRSSASQVSNGSEHFSDTTYHDVSTMINSKQDISLSQIRKALIFNEDSGTPAVKVYTYM